MPRILPRLLLLPLALVAAPGWSMPSVGPLAPPALPDLPAQEASAPIGLPLLQQRISCPALQQRLNSLLGGTASLWSITVADPEGRLLAEVNGLTPRIPASNQKLISTAFALDQLGPDARLRSQLWRLGDGSYRLTGEGDPDLALPQLQRFAKLLLGSAGGSGVQGTTVRLQVAEEPAQAWWPSGWDPSDRYYAYGAPITRLAVTSNAIHEAVLNPPGRLGNLLQRSASQQGGKLQLTLVSARLPLPADAVLLHEEASAPMHNLLSLANTESHNFTAEVLLRQAAGSWDLNEARSRATRWMLSHGLPMQGVRIVDGSGLDRGNRLTSRLLAALLLRMDQHPYGRQYLASMAIAGQRGTLRNLYRGTALQGRFAGKTGTISGVRAISGRLQTAAGPRYVSTISNGAADPNSMIGAVLLEAQNTATCL